MKGVIKIITTEKVICPKCHGTGKLYERTSAYETEEILCNYCGGYKIIIESRIHQKIIED